MHTHTYVHVWGIIIVNIRGHMSGLWYGFSLVANFYTSHDIIRAVILTLSASAVLNSLVMKWWVSSKQHGLWPNFLKWSINKSTESSETYTHLYVHICIYTVHRYVYTSQILHNQYYCIAYANTHRHVKTYACLWHTHRDFSRSSY